MEVSPADLFTEAGMGLFDWLFGKKKPQDPYASNFKSTSYRDPNASRKPDAPRPTQRELPPIEPRREPLDPNARHSHLSWRKNRSEPRDDHAFVANELLAPGWPTFGGTVEEPNGGGIAGRVSALGLPNLANLDDLAALLALPRNDLASTLIGMLSQQNYVIREIPKKSGGKRLLMAPMSRLKSLQRTLCVALVNKLPLNSCVQGFRKGYDALSNSGVHVGKRVVICMDIKDFFPSFDLRRVCGYFRWLGYARGIALAIARLTTANTQHCRVAVGRGKAGLGSKSRGFHEEPAELFTSHVKALVASNDRLALEDRPRLPQGAPTSPGIANAIVWRMDKRLTALARKFGGDYTRYADDLTFSGFEKMAKHAKLIVALVEKIVHTEGLAINKKKTRIMRKGRQQRVTGVVVNKQTNLSRRDFDLLKAILHNCIKKGPSTQNRSNHPNFKEHLRGRVAHALHIGPERGAKLKKLFDAIDWSR